MAVALLLSACVSGRPDAPGTDPSFIWPPEDAPQRVDRPLTFEAAVQRAFAVSPSLQVLAAEADAAGLAVRATRDLRNPELRGSWSEDDGSFSDTRTPLQPGVRSVPSESADTAASQWRVSARFFPPNPFTADPVRHAARSRAAAAAMRLQQERALIVDQLRLAWLTMAWLHHDYQLAEAQHAAARRAAETVALQLATGTANLAEAAAIDQLVLRTLADLQQIETARAEAQADVSALLYVEAEHLTFTELDWTAAAITPPAASEDAALLAHVRANALAGHIAGHEAAAARQSYLAARRAWIPWPRHIEGSYGEAEGSRFRADLQEVSRRNSREEEWAVSLAVEVPVFNLINHGNRVLKAQWHALEQQAGWVRESKVAEARATLAHLRRASRQLEAFTGLAGPVTERLHALTTETGDTSLFRPRDAAQHAMQATAVQRTRLHHEYEVRRLLLQLEILCGEPVEGLIRRTTSEESATP
jgi:outer membrane protein TolC